MTTASKNPARVLATSLETAGAGQTVQFIPATHWKPSRLAIITRTTPTIIEVDDVQFSRNGWERGVTVGRRCSIAAVSEEAAQRVERNAWRHDTRIKLKALPIDELSDDQLGALVAASELLTALEALVDEADLGEMDLDPEDQEKLEAARRAVAKAKGRS